MTVVLLVGEEVRAVVSSGSVEPSPPSPLPVTSPPPALYGVCVCVCVCVCACVCVNRASEILVPDIDE